MKLFRAFILLSVIASMACTSKQEAPKTQEPAKPQGKSLEARRKEFNDLLDEQWQRQMKDQPEFASIIGDKRYNDKLHDESEKAQIERLDTAKQFLARFQKLDTTGFTEQELLSLELMVYNLKLYIEGEKFQFWRQPVTQLAGVQLDYPQLVGLLAFDTIKDYDDYIARLKQLPKLFDQTTDNMRLGLKQGLLPPKYLLEKAALQTEQVGKTKPADSPFASPIKKFPSTFSKEDKDRLSASILDAVNNLVNPSFLKFAKFIKEEYAPHGRTEFGVWALGDGAARYAYDIRNQTTTDKTADEIHEMGLKEVARIEAEMLKVATELGFKDLATFRASVRKNPKLKAKSREEIVRLYQKYLDQMYAKLPALFGRLPKAKILVMQVPSYQERDSAGAFYLSGTPDGSRPGHIMVNTYKPTERTTINIETTAYHEGIPGHHLQISIAQELSDLPPFRKFTNYTAYAEGWALYSERLGEEVGLYQDPYSYFGHLDDEMLRAIRLVLDTGVHAKKWTRQQMVDFFHEHSNQSEVDVQSETDRYIADPGQALGYKLGQFKILELREWAKKELGTKFDIRAFHDVILDQGAMPLSILDEQVRKWVTKTKAAVLR